MCAAALLITEQQTSRIVHSGLRVVQPLFCFIKQSRTYSAAFFHFLIFARNVPKGATVLTWINL